MVETKRTLVVSDTHMGHAGGLLPKDLRPLWRGFDRVVFNGDTAELQMPRLRSAAERAVGRLREMAEADGVELVLVCGNHDTAISPTRYLTLMGGRVLVMHGHALHPGVAPWTRAGRAMSALTRAGLDEMPGARDRLEDRLRLAGHVALEGFGLDPTTHREKPTRLLDVLLRPQDALRAARYWYRVPAMASAFLEQYCPMAQVLVMGHSHRQGVWHHGGRSVLNTGSYGFPGRPRAVVAVGSALAVHDVRRTDAGCVLAERARYTMTLPALAGTDAVGGTACVRAA